MHARTRQEHLLADLRPEWKGDIFRRDSSEALMVRTAGGRGLVAGIWEPARTGGLSHSCG